MTASQKKDVVNKIILLRKKYADKYLQPGAIRNGNDFNRIHDKVCSELKQFAEETNIIVDPQIIFTAPDRFEEYIDSGIISEFVHINGLI